MLSYVTSYAQFDACRGRYARNRPNKLFTLVALPLNRELICDYGKSLVSAMPDQKCILEKDWNFQKSTSQSCRNFHAVCENAQILSYVTK